ncbi:uncharacterized protein DNG_04875 [Cephalotrichum gorgonifer]|uniref:RGS domain-containing protein n=1 Tax=Cephalotrichum gorgonifer TaxID=2041049 RepID=A0AAE8MZV4_9PEZI|nr:uncharacterized protein DNG_04875 [Cephalotrichum gorgonifer]
MRLPSWMIWYKKPEYRDIREYSTAVGSGQRALSPDGRNKSAVPNRLSLERVLENKTCSPMSLYDFYMYLKHIEYSPENLEFYIWFKNYEAKYARAHSPWSIKETASVSEPETEARPSEDGSEVYLDPEFAKETLGQIELLIGTAAMCTATSCKPSLATRAKAFAGIKTAPENPTPVPTDSELRAEINAVTSLFLTPDSAKELNIPPALRAAALQGLQTSPDPAHLRPVADHVYLLIRNCSHRNFIRLGVSNGTYETVCVATGLGIVLIAAGLLYVLLRAFVGASHSRYDALGAWPMWWLGVTLVLSGLRGSCFFLLLFTRRQPLPWERFDDGASVNTQGSNPVVKTLSRLMIFDRKVRVKDDGLRGLQHKIVAQSMVGGAIFATIFVLVFIFLPVWKETL